MIVDQHGLKIFLQEANPENNFIKGWNTIYITDIFKNVNFYVRGNEFTNQLYHFVENIKNPTLKNLCSFHDAAKTQKLLKQIRENALKGIEN